MKVLNKFLTLTFLLNIQIVAHSQNIQNTITVTGNGEVVAQSNQGKISASVITNDISADLAITNNGLQVQAIVEALNAIGISGNNIQTSGFSFRPNYVYNNGEYVFDGYNVSNGLSIIVTDNSIMGPVLDLIVEAGVTRLNIVSFSAVDVEELKEQALINATNDALSKAQILANASGVVLGKAIRIINSNNSNHYYNSEALPSPAPPGAIGTTILPGTSNINAAVTIEYLIENSEK